MLTKNLSVFNKTNQIFSAYSITVRSIRHPIPAKVKKKKKVSAAVRTLNAGSLLHFQSYIVSQPSITTALTKLTLF